MTENQKIKVLHIITRLDAGGSATNTIETVARLDPKRYESFLIFGKTHDPDGKIVQGLKEKQITFTYVDELRRAIHPWFDVLAFFKLLNLIKKGQYAIVHTHSSKAGILGRWAAKLAGVPRIVHTPHGHVFYGYFGKFVTGIFIVVERITATITDKIITLTDIGKGDHVRFKIAQEHKFVTIHSGIDIKQFSIGGDTAEKYRRDFRIADDCFLFGTVTRLDPIKGNAFLVEAMASVLKKFPNTRLLVAGEGSQRKYLNEKCRSLNIYDKVIFTGYRSDAAQLMSMMDAFVLSSLNEGMGRVILEAMALGNPVIATQTGGIPELVSDGDSGILVPPADADRLAEAMVDFLSDRKKAKEFGQRGKEKVSQKYSIEKMVGDIDRLYMSLI